MSNSPSHASNYHDTGPLQPPHLSISSYTICPSVLPLRKIRINKKISHPYMHMYETTAQNNANNMNADDDNAQLQKKIKTKEKKKKKKEKMEET